LRDGGSRRKQFDSLRGGTVKLKQSIPF